MTGRAAGYCAGYAVPGFANNSVPGRGFFGRGRGGGGGGGGGFGRRNQFYATGLTGWQRSGAGAPAYGPAAPMPFPAPVAPTKDQQLDALKAQADYFNDALEDIKKRIAEIEAESKK